MRKQLLRRVTWISVTVGLLALWLLVGVRRPSASQHDFERFVLSPAPASVRGVERVRLHGMDFSYLVFRFSIAKSDFETIVRSSNLSKVPSPDDLLGWSRKIRGNTGWDISLGQDWLMYTASDDHGEKTAFFEEEKGTAIVIVERR